jgi:hypothetical protein
LVQNIKKKKAKDWGRAPVLHKPMHPEPPRGHLQVLVSEGTETLHLIPGDMQMLLVQGPHLSRQLLY